MKKTQQIKQRRQKLGNIGIRSEKLNKENKTSKVAS